MEPDRMTGGRYRTGRKSPTWHKQAECRNYQNVDWWFSETPEHIVKATTICGRCPVAQECANTAIENGETFGIWGGLTPKQRRQKRVARHTNHKHNDAPTLPERRIRQLSLQPLRDYTGSAIRRRMADRGGNITEAGAAAAEWGVSVQQTARWATYQNPTIRVYLAERIADHLGTHPAAIWPEYVNMFAGPLQQPKRQR